LQHTLNVLDVDVIAQRRQDSRVEVFEWHSRDWAKVFEYCYSAAEQILCMIREHACVA